MTPLIKSLVSLTEEASDYVWFDMGDLARYSINWKNIYSVNMPFEKTAICGRDRFGDRFMVLVDQIDDAMMLVAAWALLKTHFTKTPLFAAVIDPDIGGVHIAQVDGENEITNETAAPIMGIICEFLSGVNPTGYAPTIKSSHINRTRAKKGKSPLHYTWKTVTIEPPKQKNECLVGTHASPRKHQRRGHWRNHPNGKRVWVRDCWVGDASKGMVFKDYEVGE
jgi:hypothetical protein